MTTITASTTIGINLDSGSYVNPIVVKAGVKISNVGYALFGYSDGWSISNSGSIGGTGATGIGIALFGAGNPAPSPTIRRVRSSAPTRASGSTATACW